MSDYGLPAGYWLIDYSVVPMMRQIEHRKTGIAFRFGQGRQLSSLEPRGIDDPTLELTERGATAALDAWPPDTFPW
jgi:hypothetical protein